MNKDNRNTRAIVRSHSSAVVARSRADDDAPLFTAVLKSSLWGMLATFISGLILISVLSAAALASPDPLALITPLALVALFPSAFVGGFVTAKGVKDAPALCGIICGGLITLCGVLLSIILKDLASSELELWQALLLHALVVTFSVLGAFAGNVKRAKNKFRKRFKMRG